MNANSASLLPAGSPGGSPGEHERMLSTLLSNLPGMAYRCRDDLHWTMEFVSQGCFELTGYHGDELVGNRAVSFESLILAEDRGPVRREVEAALARTGQFELNYRIRTKAGAIKWVAERGRGVFAPDGRLLAIEGFAFDITAHRQAEQAGRESEEKFAKAFLASPYPVSLHELETGRCVDANEAFLQLFGATREQVIGRIPFELGFWLDSAQRQAFVAQMQRTGSVRDLTAAFRMSGGRPGLCEISAERIELGGRPHQVVVLRDITERVRAEEALHVSEAKFAAAFRNSPDLIAITDAETGRYLEVNDALVELFGYRREDMLDRSPVELGIVPRERPAEERAPRLKNNEPIRDLRVTARTRAGRTVVLSVNAETLVLGGRRCVLSMARDVTLASQADAALRESEAKFSTAFRASPMALTIVELGTGRFIEINDVFEHLTGYTRAETLGRTTLDLGLWRSAEERAEFAARLERHGVVRNLNVTFYNRAGDPILTRCNSDLIQLGGQSCILSMVEDITEQHRAEEEKARLETQLRQSQKLEALGTLAGGIAHDFNNILTAIVVNQELAVMDLHDPVELRERLAEISRASSRAKDLVRQILAFSRQQPEQPRTPHQLQPIVQEAMGLVRASLPATIEIEQFLAADAPPVLADPTQVHQIVMNLCTNAAHAMRERPGKLTVRLTPRRLDDPRALPGLSPGMHTQLTIADTGHGMSAAVLARIFEPFFTTKGPGEGTGLGLAVVHGILKDHGGGIFVESTLGVGTRFDLYFPAVAASMVVPALPLAIAYGHGESILLVDDERSVGEAVGEMLRKLGYRVEIFSDPEAGLKRFQSAPQAFDLLLTDRTMPRLTGPQLIERARVLRPGMAALVMSGIDSRSPLGSNPAQGFSLVPKPPDIAELSQAVRAVLAPAFR